MSRRSPVPVVVTATAERVVDGAPDARPGDPPITPELIESHGLSREEYALILDYVGREPTYTELGLFSALWSEHCGYKNSRPLLRTLPTEAPWVLQGPGENAGVIDIGDGMAAAFKIESHNHPSAVEPYEGAATGVGGILRDVFTMGARPVAVLDALRFGSLDSARVRYLFDGVVRGIGDYANCVGIPNIGGEVHFDPAYEGNPLVNAMAIGLMKAEHLIRGEAAGPGNPIIAVGARTGRDGIHGATFASEELAHEADQRRPQVQVGDPFTEKLLLEASLELIRSGHIVGIQDMGAAGLASSSTEMAARSGTGVDIDVALVPVREEGMSPYEILLSESQERMLVVATAGHEDHVREILERWELEAKVIGTVTDDGVYRVREDGRIVAELPGHALVHGCPTYTREGVEAEEARGARAWTPASLPSRDLSAAEAEATLLRLLADPSIASKAWVYRQYDSTVRTNTLVEPGGDAGVIRVRGTRRALAATTDCNGGYCWLNPRVGAMAAVAEAARNLACVGARPRAVTNNLNFGNPTRPEVYFQMAEAVAGMGEACRALDTPVVSGNVSLYNENPDGAIHPTPVIGMVGVIEDTDHLVRSGLRREGDHILLLGATLDEIGGSAYLRLAHGLLAGEPPAVHLDREKALQETLLAAAARGLLRSAHDCSDGGLAVCLAESAVADREAPLGIDVTLPRTAPLDALLFGESQGRAVVSCAPGAADEVLALAAARDLPATAIGLVGTAHGRFVVRIAGEPGGAIVDLATSDVAAAWHDAIPSIMGGG
ncbi:MAG: phosphoribosylformylglycinamidine synthase subunit PurL [Gemmatimonadota bacterium]